jgi:DNA-binding transcriptional ArsR family regulator
MFKALGDPVRLRLMSMIASTGSEACVCDLAAGFDLSQPTISHHLKVLREAGLVDAERRGAWVYYRVHPDALRAGCPARRRVEVPRPCACAIRIGLRTGLFAGSFCRSGSLSDGSAGAAGHDAH